MSELCKRCSGTAAVKVSEGEFMLKVGEKYLALHNKPDGSPCLYGSGVTVRDNQKLNV